SLCAHPPATPHSLPSTTLFRSRLRPARLRRRPKAHRSRPRKPQAGMLWQIDASPFAWLEDRGPELTLHGIIDDATGEVIAAAFRDRKSTRLNSSHVKSSYAVFC